MLTQRIKNGEINGIVTSPSIVALGNFDGVHIGHQEIIKELISSEYLGIVYNFYEHPVNIIGGKGSVRVINTRAEKELLLESLGVDLLFYDDFKRVRNMTPKEFVEEMLVRTFQAKKVVCGFNYRFGKENMGDINLLEKLLLGYDIPLKIVPEVKYEGTTVSSSAIREVLISGNITQANKMLGRAYFVKGTVKHGKALGRVFGFPTVNLNFEEGKEIPKNGVYFGKCMLQGITYPVAVSIGVRPTVENVFEPRLEANIIGFDGDLYGKEIKIDFIERIRDEVKFDSVDSLKKQIALDVEFCKKRFYER